MLEFYRLNVTTSINWNRLTWFSDRRIRSASTIASHLDVDNGMEPRDGIVGVGELRSVVRDDHDGDDDALEGERERDGALELPYGLGISPLCAQYEAYQSALWLHMERAFRRCMELSIVLQFKMGKR